MTSHEWKLILAILAIFLVGVVARELRKAGQPDPLALPASHTNSETSPTPP